MKTEAVQARWQHRDGDQSNAGTPGRNLSPASELRVNVEARTQLILRIGREPGALQQATDQVRAAGLRVLASIAVPQGQEAIALVVLDNGAGPHPDATTEPVLLVEAAPRLAAINELGRCLQRSHVDVVYSYALPAQDDRLVAVFQTQDNDRAMQVLLGRSADEAQHLRQVGR